jgi:hypothetical protein
MNDFVQLISHINGKANERILLSAIMWRLSLNQRLCNPTMRNSRMGAAGGRSRQGES